MEDPYDDNYLLNVHNDIKLKPKIGEGTNIWKPSNIYGNCEIGKDCTIGAFVEITGGVIIGDRVIVSSHSFLCDRVTIGNDVFIGHGVMTINDLYPPSRKRTGSSKYWSETQIGDNCIIGSGAVLFPVNIGHHAIIGAGSVVRDNIKEYQVWAGNPAKYICDRKDLKDRDGKQI